MYKVKVGKKILSANEEYAVKNSELQKLWSKVYKLRKRFQKASFVSVPRGNSNIQKADKLVNETLDKEISNEIYRYFLVYGKFAPAKSIGEILNSAHSK